MLCKPIVLEAASALPLNGADPKICEPNGDVLSASSGAPAIVALTNDRREMRRFRIAANGSLPLLFGAGLKHASSQEISQ